MLKIPEFSLIANCKRKRKSVKFVNVKIATFKAAFFLNEKEQPIGTQRQSEQPIVSFVFEFRRALLTAVAVLFLLR